MEDALLTIPYENIVYIGDSATDIPCMRLVKSKGGYSIGVYDPEKDNRDKVYQLYTDGRISFYAPADYRAKSNISKYMKQIIDEIAAREAIKTERKVLDIPADLYKMYKGTEMFLGNYSKDMKPTERKRLSSGIEEMKKMIEGNVE